MSNNFYWLGKSDSDNIQDHIGKLVSSGMYCWDCGTTLHSEGTQGLNIASKSKMFNDECPSCNKSKYEGGKLGISGITSCYSFIWTLMKHKSRIYENINNDEPIIEDEYGEPYTAWDFITLLRYTPIEHQSPYEFS